MQKIKNIEDEHNNIRLEKLANEIKYNNQRGFTYTIMNGDNIESNCFHSIEIVISKHLIELGVSPNLKGYKYIITAVKEVLNDETVLDGVTKILYPTIAKIHNSTSQRVEKAIRHAIEVAWSKNQNSKLKDEFEYTIAVGKTRPTNSEFIAMFSQYIKLL